jgi:metal-responsive CopG/Arc/MetJ family transcriptional regulator
MPRPKLNRERVNITLPPDLLKRLDDAAAARSKTRSDLLELAALAFLEGEQDEENGRRRVARKKVEETVAAHL